jgi:hypothetical protein
MGLFVKRFWQRQRNPIISFFQHSLTFNITSITFYYSSNKKITTKQNFPYFYTKHSYFFTFFFLKNCYLFFHINQFLLQYQTKTEMKSFTKPTQCSYPVRKTAVKVHNYTSAYIRCKMNKLQHILMFMNK